MDKLNIVAGIAVDKTEDGNGYALTLEVVNTALVSDEKSESSLYVESEGPTLFEALMNSKKRLYSKLYLGSAHTIVISSEIATDDGLYSVIDVFLRNSEIRESVNLVISQQETARELIMVEGLDVKNVSYEIAEIVEEGQNVYSTAKKTNIYQAYSNLIVPGHEIVLPAFHLATNNEKPVVEINGAAVFNGDKLSEFLSPDDTQYFLIIDDNNSGGAFSFMMDNKQISARIYKYKRKWDYNYADGKLTVPMDFSMDISIAEVVGNSSETLEMQRAAELFLCGRLTQTLQHLQAMPNGDIIALGNHIYKTNNKLWQEISDDWPQIFSSADFQISTEIRIISTGIISA